MKILLVIFIVYIVVAAICFLIQVLLNGVGDQSKQPVGRLFGNSLKWLLYFIKIILNLIK